MVFNNVDLNLAMQLDPATRLGWGLIFSGFHGRRWNWDRMDFEADG